MNGAVEEVSKKVVVSNFK